MWIVNRYVVSSEAIWKIVKSRNSLYILSMLISYGVPKTFDEIFFAQEETIESLMYRILIRT